MTLTIAHKHTGCELVDLAWLRQKDMPNCPLPAIVDHLLASRRSDEEFFFLARDDKTHEPLGYGLIEVESSGVEIKKVYVLPEYRKRGIGKAIVRAEIEISRQIGENRIYTEVSEANLPSLAMIRSLGFREVCKSGSKYHFDLWIKD